jgi:hypothetical protein
MTVMNQNWNHEEIRSRLNQENMYYYAVQNLLYFHLLHENQTVQTTILLAVLYGKEHRFRVSKSEKLGRIFGPTRDEVSK